MINRPGGYPTPPGIYLNLIIYEKNYKEYINARRAVVAVSAAAGTDAGCVCGECRQ